jgi:3-methylcrotonyl-CoA carboxylase alpha subunit
VKKVLIANRGEIACRIIRSCRDMGLATVAIYSDVDRNAKHVALADEAVHVGPARAAESYLVASKLTDVARAVGADALHPGYGFLSENADFAERVGRAGMRWIGPRPQTIRDMGDKDQARRLAEEAGVPILPGSRRFPAGEVDGIEAAAEVVGFPLLVKAAAGGGGIGMRLVESREALAGIAESTQAHAQRAFGDGTIFLERYIARARHIEVQVFGFGDGRVVHLFERDCSVQRRFQKVIEEAPAPNVTPSLRGSLVEAAVALASEQRYAGAGTVEFVVDVESDAFYFLEMNTRIQVEHPVTEETTGVDLIAMQLALALDKVVPVGVQESIKQEGWAIEVRLYAEDPQRKFLPSPGKLERLEFPSGEGLRIESGMRTGDHVTPFYDPMIAKIIATGVDRGDALQRIETALAGTRIEGIASNLDFLKACVAHEVFRAGDVHTRFIEDLFEDLLVSSL